MLISCNTYFVVSTDVSGIMMATKRDVFLVVPLLLLSIFPIRKDRTPEKNCSTWPARIKKKKEITTICWNKTKSNKKFLNPLCESERVSVVLGDSNFEFWRYSECSFVKSGGI